MEEFRQGWKTLLASSVGVAFGLSGLPYYTFGVFVIPLTQAFSWTRGQTSTAASFLILGTAITAPIVGTIIDKFGVRRVALASMFAMALAYLGLTQIDARIGVFYIAWFVLSLVGGGTTPVVWTRAVNLWFDNSRGLGLGLALAGSGVAGIFLPALCATLIDFSGWRAGYIGMATAIFAIPLPAVAFLLREKAPSAARQNDVNRQMQGLTFRQSLSNYLYWKIAGGFVLVSAAVAMLLLNLVPLLTDRGFRPLEAARIAGVLGLAVVFGRVTVGFLVDRIPAPRVALWLFASTALGCLLLTIDPAPAWVAVISVILFGFASAAEVHLLAFLIGRYFGMRAYGKIYGSQITFFYGGAAVGPWLAGVIYDHFNTYLPMLRLCSAFLIFGALVLGGLGSAAVAGKRMRD